MRKHGDRGERRASPHPTEKDSHLQLANIEFEIARKPSVALLGRQRHDVEIDAFGLHCTVDQKARSVIFVAGQNEAQPFHTYEGSWGLISFNKRRAWPRTSSDAIRAMIVLSPAVT